MLSLDGTARLTLNTFKGEWRAELREMSALLREQRDMLKRI